MPSLIQFRFKTKADEVARHLDDHARRQIRFALANAINRPTQEVALQTKVKLQMQFRFRSASSQGSLDAGRGF